jgi:hypothetical protein
VSLADSDLEEQVRRLASIGLSTRKIATTIGDVSQSTVVRVLAKINSGPQPVLRDQPLPGRTHTIAWVALAAAAVAMAVTFIVLTAAVATIAWKLRISHGSRWFPPGP